MLSINFSYYSYWRFNYPIDSLWEPLCWLLSPFDTRSVVLDSILAMYSVMSRYSSLVSFSSCSRAVMGYTSKAMGAKGAHCCLLRFYIILVKFRKYVSFLKIRSIMNSYWFILIFLIWISIFYFVSVSSFSHAENPSSQRHLYNCKDALFTLQF